MCDVGWPAQTGRLLFWAPYPARYLCKYWERAHREGCRTVHKESTGHLLEDSIADELGSSLCPTVPICPLPSQTRLWLHSLASPSENTRGGLQAAHPGTLRAAGEELPSETFTVAHLCWKLTLEPEWPPWSPTCLCQPWFQYLIIKLADGALGMEGREKPSKGWLSVNVRKEVHQQIARAHGGTYLFIYFLLLTFGLNFQTPLFNFKLNVSCNMQDIRKQEGRKPMLKQGFARACTSF